MPVRTTVSLGPYASSVAVLADGDTADSSSRSDHELRDR
jgi:hypothetical protein